MWLGVHDLLSELADGSPKFFSGSVVQEDRLQVDVGSPPGPGTLNKQGSSILLPRLSLGGAIADASSSIGGGDLDSPVGSSSACFRSSRRGDSVNFGGGPPYYDVDSALSTLTPRTPRGVASLAELARLEVRPQPHTREVHFSPSPTLSGPSCHMSTSPMPPRSDSSKLSMTSGCSSLSPVPPPAPPRSVDPLVHKVGGFFLLFVFVRWMGCLMSHLFRWMEGYLPAVRMCLGDLFFSLIGCLSEFSLSLYI